MNSTLLNISGKIDPNIVNIFEAVNNAINEFNIPYVIIGATARDLVLHFGHDAKIERATQDVDFAIEVPNWAAFNALKERLCDDKFKTTRSEHRLISPLNTAIDIIPFGQVADKQSSISWPPEGDIVMNVLGFQDACDSAEWVRIQNDPILDIPVASPAGLSLLKCIAWTNRVGDIRKKDATDIAYLLSTYEKIPVVVDQLYELNDSEIMELYDWDITQAASHLLGKHAKDIAKQNTHQAITRLIKGELGGLNLEKLAVEMGDDFNVKQSRNEQLLSAFVAGFS